MVFWKRPKTPAKEQLLLPANTRKDHEALEQEKLTAQEFLGIKVRPGENSAATITSYTRDTVKRAVAYHRSSNFYDDSLLNLRRVFDHTNDFTFLVRTVRESPRAYIKHLEMEKSVSNEHRTLFLEEIQEWALPRKLRQLSGHDMLIWGPKEQVVPVAHEETAALHGKVIGYCQLGPVLRSVIDGAPMDMSDTPEDPFTGSMDPVWYAAPLNIVWRDRYYELPHINKAFAFFSGVFKKPEEVSSALELGDLLIRAENVGRIMHFTAVLRVEMDTNGKVPDFSATARILSKLGKWELRMGSDIRTAFLAFIPGSAPIKEWHRHSIAVEVDQTLHGFTRCLRSTGDRNGNYIVGINNGQPLLLDYRVRPSILYVGPSKTGKTTKALEEALETTKNVVWLPLTAGEFEAAPKVFELFGGRVIPLNLPDAYADRQGSNGRFRKEVIMEQQEKLHAEDKVLALKIVEELDYSWEMKGRVVGLPLTFKIESGDTVRLYSFYEHFLKAFRDLWKRRYEKTGEWAVVVADNFSAIRLSDDDPLLGSIPEATGRNLGILLNWMVSNGRNVGILTRILTHSKDDLDYITTGLYRQFGLVMQFEHNEYSWVKVFQNGEIYADRVEVTLPKSILALVGRREPGQGEAEWTQETSSAPS